MICKIIQLANYQLKQAMQLVSWIAKQTGKISDRFNDYKFYVKQQPQVIDSSSTVCIQTFDSRDMTATIPCSFRWFTVRNGLTTEIPHFKGNTFICEPADVGCLLQVEIASSDPECNGTAVLTYGPVKFDALLKKQIQMALSTGESSFVVDIGESSFSRECHLRIEQQRITMHHIPSETGYTFEYNIIEPKIQVMGKMTSRVRIIFNPKYYQQLQRFMSRLWNRQVMHEEIARSPFLQLGMNNRKARDAFVFIAKAFNTKKHLKTTTYVSNLQKQLDFTSMTEKECGKSLDYIQHISQLNYDIGKLIDINGKNYMEKRVYLEENKRLEREIDEIVGTYVKIIEEKFQGREEFEKSFVVLKEKEEEIRMHKEEKTIKGVAELEQRIAILEQQNLMLRQAANTGANGTANRQSSPTNSPFKRKSIFEPVSPSSSNFIQTPSFEPLRVEEETQLKKELRQITFKYEAAMRQIQQLKNLITHQKTTVEDVHLQDFEARSVKSVNHNVLNRSPSQASSSMLLSTHSYAINPQRLKFTSSPIKPTSPQSSLESFPLISALQQQNTTLKQQISELQQQLESLTNQQRQKQQKYRKKITELSEQVEMYRRNNDVLNRSQHLSMEMDQYNEEQMTSLKEENVFLKKEIQSSQALCLKYKAEIKKYKQLDKHAGEKSLILSDAAI